MDQQKFLLELDEAFDRISCGLNAMKLMVYGLEGMQDPYADGFYAVWLDLSRAEAEVRRLLDAVSTAQATA